MVSRKGGRMSKPDAQLVVLAVWNGRQKEDERYLEALGILGLNRSQMRNLGREARKVCCGRDPLAVLTPTGGQHRR